MSKWWSQRVSRFVVTGLVLPWALTTMAGAYAASGLPPPDVRAEVESLLASIEAGDCRFQRNGSWHQGAQARAHLSRKWKEMERRQIGTSTEGFIEQGASGSMLSGQPYAVQCGNGPVQSSREWLMNRLAAQRAARK